MRHLLCLSCSSSRPRARVPHSAVRHAISNSKVTVGNITEGDTFEVFDSKGAWLALFGKPLLKKFKAIYDYDTDIVKTPKDSDWVVLQNQYPCE
jgi:hypothetical protein